MEKKTSLVKEFTKGILKDNPLLILLLGLCPSLAVTTSASNGLGMGIATTAVLTLSNVIISALRKIIPDQVRIPAFITIIASVTTIIQFLMQAYVPALNQSLGIFIPLITVNCIILGRAEAFASRNAIMPSLVDGLGMGLGFTIALTVIASFREILGNGSFFGWAIPFVGEGHTLQPIAIFSRPPGGFAVFAIVIAIATYLSNKFYAQQPSDTMDRAHFPGSLSERTDAAILGGEEQSFPKGVGAGQMERRAVPEILSDSAAIEEDK